jgi:hypothetical protein
LAIVRDNGEFTFGPLVRRCVLTFHIVVSVGWSGVDLCVLVLAILGGSSGDPIGARAALVVLGPIGGYLLIPLSLLTLLSGIVLAWGTRWKLVRYWWVVITLVLSIAATVAVGFALRPRLDRASALARAGADVGMLGSQIAVAASIALLVLCAVTAINVAKPWGRSPIGRGRR